MKSSYCGCGRLRAVEIKMKSRGQSQSKVESGWKGSAFSVHSILSCCCCISRTHPVKLLQSISRECGVESFSAPPGPAKRINYYVSVEV